MECVAAYARNQLDAEKIYNYSSSFGAYITLRFLHERKENPFDRIAFRCPAIKMYDAMEQNITEDEAVPFSVVEEFSENNIIELYPVVNADHPFSNPDYMDFAIQKMIEFFE